MASAGLLGALGGAGQGMIAVAERKIEQEKSAMDEAREARIAKIQQDYSMERLAQGDKTALERTQMEITADNARQKLSDENADTRLDKENNYRLGQIAQTDADARARQKEENAQALKLKELETLAKQNEYKLTKEVVLAPDGSERIEYALTSKKGDTKVFTTEDGLIAHLMPDAAPPSFTAGQTQLILDAAMKGQTDILDEVKKRRGGLPPEVQSYLDSLKPATKSVNLR